MRKRCDTIERLVSMLLMAICLTACSAIDDDLSDCVEEEKELKLEYRLRLVTNMTTELQTQLTTLTEVSVANALRSHLSEIFSDNAHDIDLSFYDTEGDLKSLFHKRDIINANQTSYTLTLPMRKYMHLAVANIAENSVVNLNNEQYSNTSMLRQTEGTTLESHTTGLFSARQPMEVLSDVDQTFNVRLYMVNSAVALILKPQAAQYRDIKVYATGFANQFNIRDSVFVFSGDPQQIIAQKVETDNDLLCFCSVNFPSHDTQTRADDEASLWQLLVYVTTDDGKTTKSVLDVSEPLKAGELKIIKGDIDTDGGIRPYDSNVGVSVTLDWNEGGNYNQEL